MTKTIDVTSMGTAGALILNAEMGKAMARIAELESELETARDERDQWHDGFAAMEISIKLARGQMARVQDELSAARQLRAAVQPLGSMAALTEACAAYDTALSAGGGGEGT